MYTPWVSLYQLENGEMILFIIVTKHIKKVEINLIKNVKVLYKLCCKTSLKDILKNLKNVSSFQCGKSEYCKDIKSSYTLVERS